jgi:hypothetical protein
MPKGTKLIKDESLRRIRYQVRLPRFMVEWLRDQEQSAGQIIEAALRSNPAIRDHFKKK